MFDVHSALSFVLVATLKPKSDAMHKIIHSTVYWTSDETLLRISLDKSHVESPLFQNDSLVVLRLLKGKP